MRANIAVVSVLAAAFLVSASPATGGEEPRARSTRSAAAGLPEMIPGGRIVDLPGGDRFKIKNTHDGTVLMGQRYDAATNQWDAGRVLVRDACSDFDLRTAAGAVTVVAACLSGDHGLYSPDTVSWTTHALDAHSVTETSISPDGRHAVWVTFSGYTTWDAAQGWVERDSLLEAREGADRAAVITDEGAVSLVESDAASPDVAPCTVTFWATTAAGATLQQQLRVDTCRWVSLIAVDTLTLQFANADEAELVTTISRPDVASPWAVSAIAPLSAPGLIHRSGRLGTKFVTATGLPLLAVGSSDDSSVFAQVYDPTGQRWSLPHQISRIGQSCRWDRYSSGSRPFGEFGVYAPTILCQGRWRLFSSSDGQHWRGVWLGNRPLGIAPTMAWVSASNRRRTLIFSPERGVVRLPLGAPKPCDVIVPSGPDTALRLTSNKADGWPSVLQESTDHGWRRTDTMIPKMRVGHKPCRDVISDGGFTPPSYRFEAGGVVDLSLTIWPARDGKWLVQGTRD